MAQAKISGDQLRSAMVGLDRFREAIADPKPALEKVMLDLETAADAGFMAGKRPLGGNWAKLSPAYAMFKARIRPGRPILTFDGHLAASLGGARGPGAVRVVRGNKLRYGTTIPYAGFHNRGTSKMPARQVLPVNGRTLQEMVGKAMHEHIMGVLS